MMKFTITFKRFIWAALAQNTLATERKMVSLIHYFTFFGQSVSLFGQFMTLFGRTVSLFDQFLTLFGQTTFLIGNVLFLGQILSFCV